MISKLKSRREEEWAEKKDTKEDTLLDRCYCSNTSREDRGQEVGIE